MMTAGGSHPASGIEQLTACCGAKIKDVAGEDTPQRRLHALTQIWYGVKAPACIDDKVPELQHALTAVCLGSHGAEQGRCRAHANLSASRACVPDDSWEQRQRLCILLRLDGPEGIPKAFCSEASIPVRAYHS